MEQNGVKILRQVLYACFLHTSNFSNYFFFCCVYQLCLSTYVCTLMTTIIYFLFIYSFSKIIMLSCLNKRQLHLFCHFLSSNVLFLFYILSKLLLVFQLSCFFLVSSIMYYLLCLSFTIFPPFWKVLPITGYVTFSFEVSFLYYHVLYMCWENNYYYSILTSYCILRKHFTCFC